MPRNRQERGLGRSRPCQLLSANSSLLTARSLDPFHILWAGMLRRLLRIQHGQRGSLLRDGMGARWVAARHASSMTRTTS